MATKSNKDIFVGGFKKLLSEQWQADVRLKAGDSDESAIFAHKLFLVARSEVFKKILESDEFKASAKLVETVTLSEMKHEEVIALVEFIYSVDGSISSESLKKHVRSLFLAADKYEIPHLRDLCRNELISSLSPSNALSILELAQIPFDKALNDAAFTKIITNMSTIASGEEFKLFVVNYPTLAVEIMKASITRLSSKRTCGYCGRSC
ncbi:PREDICTED: putative BTB/POZ domain-containing protein At2g40450 [Camelina sativa]|uniref:BTB/POZ domain-containing protein At2g40450 n=1 Tax=Camelina sativa TaxID=90675 RepID=A0ABM1RNZ3_CAMSA|nr:PREDICTED: putative BTB/POZ domain-containing protein At2g40450 [Camelina sativa]